MAAPFSAVGAFFDAIERIDHEHRVARFGKPLAHLPHRGPKAEDIRPQQHARAGAGRRVYEVRVAGPVRRRHRHLGVGDRDRVHDARQHHRHAGAQQDAELPPCDLAARLEFLSIFLKLILFAHSRSSGTL